MEVRLALRPEGLAILEGIGVVTLADFANLVASPQELLESAILVAGGSPCQDVSSLKSSPPGLRSARTNLFRCVPEFARACEDIVKDLGKNIPVLAMLENVCNTPCILSGGCDETDFGRFLRLDCPVSVVLVLLQWSLSRFPP